MIFRTKKASLALIPATLAVFAATSLAVPAQAGILNRHHKAAGLAAGLAAHHMAKHSHGNGMMHRHPVLTGIVAGAAANHMLKKHH